MKKIVLGAWPVLRSLGVGGWLLAVGVAMATGAARAETINVTAANFESCRTLVNGNTYLFIEDVDFTAPAAQVQPVQALPVQQTNPLAGLITMADAKRIALAAAGVAETDARNFKVELDSEGVLMLYEVEFDSGFHEYEYKIDARTGAIVGTKKKLDIF